MMVCGSLLLAEMRPESCFCTLCPFPQPLVLQGGRALPRRGLGQGELVWHLYFSTSSPFSASLCCG